MISQCGEGESHSRGSDIFHSPYQYKVGCEVHAFEANGRLFRELQKNVDLNPGLTSIHMHKAKIGNMTGSRLDEFVTGCISVLKMDIDGFDSYAMDGASGLLDAGVEVINLELSPEKHLKKGGGSDETYLASLFARGYEAYLVDCYNSRPNSFLERHYT